MRPLSLLTNSRVFLWRSQHVRQTPLVATPLVATPATTTATNAFSSGTPPPITDASSILSISDEGIVTLALNNPKRRNALSTTVLHTLLEQLKAIKAHSNAKVVVIKAFDDPSKYNGVFCSGHDLKEMIHDVLQEDQEAYQERMRQLFSLCSKVMTEIATFPVPTIAEVDGIATAAGCQLVASCDLAVATSSSRFATPGVHLGLFCSTPAVPLVRTIHRKHAAEMLLTGDMIFASRAYDMGLINRIVDLPSNDIISGYETDNDCPDKRQQKLSSLLHEQVHALAASIASKSKNCIMTGLHTLRAQQECAHLEDAYSLAEDAMVRNLLTKDAVEGIDAFLGKRAPQWTDTSK